MSLKDSGLCDEDCNHCPIILHKNSRMVSLILNMMYNRFGNAAYHIVQDNCPNLTCCADCHIDDFCHDDGCDIVAQAAKQNPK